MSHRFSLLLLLIPALSACLFAQLGGYDGPAQLPIATVNSSMAQTPAGGAVINVNTGDNLQSALDSAQCGTVIQLQAAATFTGDFKLPALACDNNHWIIIRTNSPDSALPAEGTRVTPCYAGVVSLEGRPQYPCGNPQNVLTRFVSKTANGPIILRNGANHYRLLGLELTRPAGTKGAPILISVEKGGSASSIIVDRSWVHGTTADDTASGIGLSGTNNVAIVDSYFSDFHCTSRTGSCIEAHAIGGGMGNYQDGVYKIQDNFLESSGQAVMFGGGAATTTPTDITIQFNHFFKPWQWMPGSSPFQGGSGGNPFIVRHHLELKNAIRVLIDSNLMENVWGGFGESGFATLLNPKNQHTRSGNNVCPICAVTDVTVRYTHIIHASGGIVIATALSGHGLGDGGAPALIGTRFSIHDVVMDDISQKYVGEGSLFLVANQWPTNPVNTITINHITGFPDPQGGLLMLGNLMSNPAMYGLVFTNNIASVGSFPVWNIGFGRTSCAHTGVPLNSLNNCFVPYTFNTNAIVSDPSQFSPASWPANNFFAASPADVDFANYNGGNGGDYTLQPGSPYIDMGTDGKNLGADIAGLNQALAGVE
ncbi:MAG: hypothetical protein WCB53_22735 [Terriglobales bacterium]